MTLLSLDVGESLGRWETSRSVHGESDTRFLRHLLDVHDEYCEVCKDRLLMTLNVLVVPVDVVKEEVVNVLDVPVTVVKEEVASWEPEDTTTGASKHDGVLKMDDHNIVPEATKHDGVLNMDDHNVVPEATKHDGVLNMDDHNVVPEATKHDGVLNMDDHNVVPEATKHDGVLNMDDHNVVPEATKHDGVLNMDDHNIVPEATKHDGVLNMDDHNIVPEATKHDGVLNMDDHNIVPEATKHDGVLNMDDHNVVPEATKHDGVLNMDDHNIVPEATKHDGVLNMDDHNIVPEATKHDGVLNMDDHNIVPEAEIKAEPEVDGYSLSGASQPDDNINIEVSRGFPASEIKQEPDMDDDSFTGLEQIHSKTVEDIFKGVMQQGPDQGQPVEQPGPAPTHHPPPPPPGAHIPMPESAPPPPGPFLPPGMMPSPHRTQEHPMGQPPPGFAPFPPQFYSQPLPQAHFDPGYAPSWPQALTEDTTVQDTSRRIMLKWESDEDLGPVATISPILYCNLVHPELKTDYPVEDSNSESGESPIAKETDSDYVPDSETDETETANSSTSCTCSTTKPHQRQMDDDQLVCDETFPNIYVKKYVSHTDKKRPYDTVHSCKYCQKLFTHIQDHIEHMHHSEKEVCEIIALKQAMKKANYVDKKTKKKIKLMQAELRYQGDNTHNQAVTNTKEGELLVQRKGLIETFSAVEYGPCPKCLLWLKIDSSISVHQKTCIMSAPASFSNDSKGMLKIQSKELAGMNSPTASPDIQKVFAVMRNDEVGLSAKKDKLIMSLGEIWLAKGIGNKLTRYRVSSFRMRLASRLLLEVQKQLDDPNLKMWHLISPRYFDSTTNATILLCQPEPGDDLKHPSVALKVGYDLSRLAGLKIGKSIKTEDDIGKVEAQDFLQLVKLEWTTKVGKLAQVSVADHHFDSRRPLPHPKDIETVAKDLVTMIADLDLGNDNQYALVARLILPRLMVYNRRRSGEIEALPLKRYHNRARQIDVVEEALMGELTVMEKYLLQSQELIWIRGKRGKPVPVLLPADVQEPLKYLTNPVVRTKGGVKADSPYLFANTGYGVFRALDCLREMLVECGADLLHPERLTSIGYRAYMATISRCVGLQPHQVQWLCDHLGHTEDVHKTYYRHTLGGIERVQLGKLILMQDLNMVGKFSGKSLDEIQFTDILGQVDGATDEEQGIEPQHVEEEPVLDFADSVLDFADPVNEEAHTVKRAVRSKWNDEENAELQQYAAPWLKDKKTPSRRECLKFIQLSKKAGGLEQIHSKTVEDIFKGVMQQGPDQGQPVEQPGPTPTHHPPPPPPGAHIPMPESAPPPPGPFLPPGMMPSPHRTQEHPMGQPPPGFAPFPPEFYSQPLPQAHFDPGYTHFDPGYAPSWPQALTEDTTVQDNSRRIMLKWESDEDLGPVATISPILYCNMVHPELKTDYPEWSERSKQIAKFWRKLSHDDKAPYLLKARKHRGNVKAKAQTKMTAEQRRKKQEAALQSHVAMHGPDMFPSPEGPAGLPSPMHQSLGGMASPLRGVPPMVPDSLDGLSPGHSLPGMGESPGHTVGLPGFPGTEHPFPKGPGDPYAHAPSTHRPPDPYAMPPPTPRPPGEQYPGTPGTPRADPSPTGRYPSEHNSPQDPYRSQMKVPLQEPYPSPGTVHVADPFSRPATPQSQGSGTGTSRPSPQDPWPEGDPYDRQPATPFTPSAPPRPVGPQSTGAAGIGGPRPLHPDEMLMRQMSEHTPGAATEDPYAFQPGTPASGAEHFPTTSRPDGISPQGPPRMPVDMFAQTPGTPQPEPFQRPRFPGRQQSMPELQAAHFRPQFRPPGMLPPGMRPPGMPQEVYAQHVRPGFEPPMDHPQGLQHPPPSAEKQDSSTLLMARQPTSLLHNKMSRPEKKQKVTSS